MGEIDKILAAIATISLTIVKWNDAAVSENTL